MRKIGHIDDASVAKRFSDYLYAKGVDNEIEGQDAEGWDVWVHDEEQIPAAKDELGTYLLNPDVSMYVDAMKAADARQKDEKKGATTFKEKVFDREKIINRPLFSIAPITFALIAISVVVTLLGGLGSGSPLTQWLSITSYSTAEGIPEFDPSLPEIQQGQVWRLVTPIFIHAALMAPFGLLHLLFNMLWLKDLGLMLETSEGRKGMLTKVLVLAILSNLGQFLNAGPAFGGMSGVVYGLLGYCWVRGRFDLTSGLFVPNQIVIMMMVWFFLCLFGAMGSIANGAHGVGLVAGIVWGYVSALRVNARHA